MQQEHTLCTAGRYLHVRNKLSAYALSSLTLGRLRVSTSHGKVYLCHLGV